MTRNKLLYEPFRVSFKLVIFDIMIKKKTIIFPKEYIYIYNSLAGQMVDIEAIATHSTGSRGKGPRYLT
jgi:hypothetical protein